MLKKTRKGTHAEYLANYYLSILGFTAPVPRQEDYGIDLFCNLTTENEHQIFQGEPFMVQVKSSFEEITFGKKKDGWNKHEIDFLFSIKSPLFFGIVNLEDDALNIYPTSLLWFIKKEYPNCSHIVFRMNEKVGESIHHIPKERKNIRSWKSRGGDGYRYICDLQSPLLKITSKDLKNKERRSLFKEILKIAIRMEQINIVFDELGLPHFHWPFKYSTNSSNIEYKNIHYDDEPQISNPRKIMEKTGQMLIALALSFKLHGYNQEYLQMTEITKLLPDYHYIKELHDKHPELFAKSTHNKVQNG